MMDRQSMMRKRACSSSGAKLKKRQKNMPQQTKSVKITAKNEEKVHLDYLVVEKIASLTELKFAPNLFQELVSRAFANALRSCYSKKKLELSFSIPCDDDDYDVNYDNYDYDHDYPTVVLLSISGLSRESEDIKIRKENLSQAMQQIFARFRRIQLEEAAIDNEAVASFLIEALNRVNDVAIDTLHLDLKYGNLLGCQELIEKLSASLQVLRLCIYLTSEDQMDDDDDEAFDSDQMDDDDDDDESSKGFWQTVVSCSKLVRLDVEFNYDLYEEDYGYFETSNAVLVQISNGIKRSKIKHFRTNLQYGEEGRRTMEWLPRAFAKNENLRHLDIDTYFEGGCYLGDLVNVENGQLVLSRLESLNIKIGDGTESRKDWEASFQKVLPAMSDHAVLKISLKYCKKDVGNILLVYLQLSHRTARRINLRLLFWKDDVNVIDKFNEGLRQLSSMKELRGLKTISCGAWTRILYGNANLMVKAHHGSI